MRRLGLGDMTLRSGGLEVSMLLGMLQPVCVILVKSVSILSLSTLRPSWAQGKACSLSEAKVTLTLLIAKQVCCIILTSLGERMGACGETAAIWAHVGGGGVIAAVSYMRRTGIVRSLNIASRKEREVMSFPAAQFSESIAGSSFSVMMVEAAKLTSVAMSSETFLLWSWHRILTTTLMIVVVVVGEDFVDTATVKRISASLRLVRVSSSTIHLVLIR